MIDGLGVDALDEAEVIHNLRGVGQEFADPRAAPAMLLELERGAGEGQRGLITRHAGEALLAM